MNTRNHRAHHSGLHEQQNNAVDNKTEAENIVKAAAKLIKNDINLVKSLVIKM